MWTRPKQPKREREIFVTETNDIHQHYGVPIFLNEMEAKGLDAWPSWFYDISHQQLGNAIEIVNGKSKVKTWQRSVNNVVLIHIAIYLNFKSLKVSWTSNCLIFSVNFDFLFIHTWLGPPSWFLDGVSLMTRKSGLCDTQITRQNERDRMINWHLTQMRKGTNIENEWQTQT